MVRYPFEVYDILDQPLSGQTSNIVTRLIHNGSIASESVTVTEVDTSGQYEATFIPLQIGTYGLFIDKTGISVDTRIEGCHYEVEENDLDDIKTLIDSIDSKINRILGLVHENIYHKSITYDINNRHISSVVEIYDSSTNAINHDGITGLISSYNLTVSRDELGKITSFLMVKN